MAKARLSSRFRASLIKVKGPARLYGREGCHLCDEMAAQLSALGIAFEKIDVDSDPHLRLRYGRDVPVLVSNEVVVKHRLTPEAIAKLR